MSLTKISSSMVNSVSATQIDTNVSSISGTYTLAASDENNIILFNSASAATVYVPANSAVPFPVGTQIAFIQQGTAAMTLTGAAGVSVLSYDNTFATNGQYTNIGLLQIAENTWIVGGGGGTGSGSTGTFPAWYPTNLQTSKTTGGWTNFQSALAALTAANPAGTTSVTTPGGTYPSTGFWGGVLLRDGRVLCVPYGNDFTCIYNLSTDNVTTPAVTILGGTEGAVLLPDGRVYIIPYSYNKATIFDPAGVGSVTTPVDIITQGAYVGGVVMQDGRVFIVPNIATNPIIFDPSSGRTSTPNLTITGCTGGVLLPDGRVFCVPHTSNQAYIYDPSGSGSVTTPSAIFPGTTLRYLGGVLLPDGRVFCVPYTAGVAVIFDPANPGTLTTPPGTYISSEVRYGTLLPDGRVYMAPYAGTTARIYDPVSNTTTTNGTFTASQFFGSVLLQDGRVFLVPRGSTTARIFDHNTALSPTLDTNFVTSPYYNKV